MLNDCSAELGRRFVIVMGSLERGLPQFSKGSDGTMLCDLLHGIMLPMWPNGGRIIMTETQVITGRNVVQIDPTVRFYGGGTIVIGNHVQIDAYTVIVCIEEMEIGDGTRICSHCSLHSGPKLTIGKNCEISAGVKIYTHSDYYPVIGEKYRAPVNIGNGVNLGANTVILPGVTILDNIAVGAQSLVTYSLVEEGWIYAGVPARPLKERERKSD